MEYDTEPKQFIIVRKDLNLSPGKFAAQVGHGVQKIFTDMFMYDGDKKYTVDLSDHPQGDDIIEWLNNESYAKVTLEAKNETKLLEMYQLAKSLKVPCVLITDQGRTEVEEGTNTVCVIGPLCVLPFPDLMNKLKRLQLFKGFKNKD